MKEEFLKIRSTLGECAASLAAAKELARLAADRSPN
jgi:hypothetical protein